MGQGQGLANNVDSTQTLQIAAITTSANGDVVDLQGYEGACFEVIAGVVTDASHTIEFQECATTDGTFTAVAAADMEGDSEPVLATNVDEVNYMTEYIGTQRYVRAITTVTDSPSSGGVYGVNVLRHRKRHAPNADTQTP